MADRNVLFYLVLQLIIFFLILFRNEAQFTFFYEVDEFMSIALELNENKIRAWNNILLSS